MALFEDRTIIVEGLDELAAALRELPKATENNVLRRVLKKRAQPIADRASGLVRTKTKTLKKSIGVGTRLSRSQASQHLKQPGDVEVFIGAGALVQAITEEFGTIRQEPHPFLRPAWDAGQDRLLEGIKADLWAEIKAAAKRLARKTARLNRSR